jgi:hypothetical protein
MADSLNNEERELLLTAYFDNELGPEDRARVELMLAENPNDAEMLQQWRENGNAIRDLPSFSLDDGFAARVLAAPEISSDQHHANATIVNVQDRVGPDSETNWRIGLGAIATLAAMLLLTLFVFPAMIDSKFADHQPETSGSGEVVSPEGSKNDIDPGGPENHQPIVGPLKSSLPGGNKNGGPVDPIVLNFTGPHVERVLWIEDKSLADLETVLANHSIRLLGPDGAIENQVHLVSQSTNGVEALYVVSSIARMKQATLVAYRSPLIPLKRPLPSAPRSIQLPCSSGF